jgi:uncharacterized protein YjbI with pentapeptide repeats
VRFTGADLRDTDLRRSSFEGCDFEAADMRGAKLTRIQAATLMLSEEQLDSIAWESDDGDEPGGG